MKSSVLDGARCVRCRTAVDVRASQIACSQCGQIYPRVGRIPVLLPRPEAHVELWRRQLARLTSHGREVERSLEAEADAPGLLPDGRTRLRAMGDGVRRQIEEFVDLVGPSLGGPLSDAEGALPRGVVEYSYYLYRDWGWPDGDRDENRSALEAVQEVVSGQGLGRMLVLGAGGARLAYDLHRQCHASETVAVDIDPYLFVIAESVVCGATPKLTESSLNVFDTESVSVSWTLRAPVPIADGRFHFMFANGLEPPFVDGSFDTIVTPWFIDRVPTDMEAFLATLGRLLGPGGRWINHGALLYAPETPIARRYCRQELFDLAGRAGFRVRKWSDASRPYLVSPLSGSGKVERTLTFEALREA